MIQEGRERGRNEALQGGRGGHELISERYRNGIWSCCARTERKEQVSLNLAHLEDYFCFRGDLWAG